MFRLVYSCTSCVPSTSCVVHVFCSSPMICHASRNRRNVQAENKGIQCPYKGKELFIGRIFYTRWQNEVAQENAQVKV